MKKYIATIIAILAFSAVAADGPWQEQRTDVTFAWDLYPLPDHHLRIYASTDPGAYFGSIQFDAAPGATSYTAIGLDPSVTWYFVATAVAPSGIESLPTDEISLPPQRTDRPLGFIIQQVVVSTTLRPR